MYKHFIHSSLKCCILIKKVLDVKPLVPFIIKNMPIVQPIQASFLSCSKLYMIGLINIILLFVCILVKNCIKWGILCNPKSKASNKNLTISLRSLRIVMLALWEQSWKRMELKTQEQIYKPEKKFTSQHISYLLPLIPCERSE